MSSLAVAPVIQKRPGTQKARAVGFAVLRSRETPTEKECAFDEFVRENGIPEILWTESIAVREWAKRHAAKRYVPERVLAAFNIVVSDKTLGLYSERARF